MSVLVIGDVRFRAQWLPGKARQADTLTVLNREVTLSDRTVSATDFVDMGHQGKRLRRDPFGKT